MNGRDQQYIEWMQQQERQAMEQQRSRQAAEYEQWLADEDAQREYMEWAKEIDDAKPE